MAIAPAWNLNTLRRQSVETYPMSFSRFSGSKLQKCFTFRRAVSFVIIYEAGSLIAEGFKGEHSSKKKRHLRVWGGNSFETSKRRKKWKLLYRAHCTDAVSERSRIEIARDRWVNSRVSENSLAISLCLQPKWSGVICGRLTGEWAAAQDQHIG